MNNTKSRSWGRELSYDYKSKYRKYAPRSWGKELKISSPTPRVYIHNYKMNTTWEDQYHKERLVTRRRDV